MNHRIAVSGLHKALRKGAIEQANYCAAFLSRYTLGAYAAWRRVLAFPAEDFGGVGAEVVVALYHSYRSTGNYDTIYAAIHYLCELVQVAGRLNRDADELKCAALFWLQGGKDSRPWLPDRQLTQEDDPVELALEQQKAALAVGNIERAAHISVWMLKKKATKDVVWRNIFALMLQYPGLPDNMKHLNALYSAWRSGYEDDNLFSAIIYLCAFSGLGVKSYEVTQVKGAAIGKLKNKTIVPIPADVLDMHAGNDEATLEDFWQYVNRLGPASAWREDAMKMQIKPKKPKKNDTEARKRAGQMSLFDS